MPETRKEIWDKEPLSEAEIEEGLSLISDKVTKDAKAYITKPLDPKSLETTRLDSDREFLKRAFEVDEGKKELPELFINYLEENGRRDILEQIGQARTWEDFKNKIEIIQSKDPQMSLRIINLFSKFQKTPR